MEFWFKLNYYYHSSYSRLIRFFSTLFFLFLIIYLLSADKDARLPIFIFNLMLMLEIFFRYKIGKVRPKLEAKKNNGNKPFNSFTLRAISLILSSVNSKQVLEKLFKEEVIKQFMIKANLVQKDIAVIELKLSILASGALEVAKTFNQKFVTPIDIFITYLMITEDQTRLLFAKQLKSEDIGNIMFWLKRKFAQEENPVKKRFHFTGGGLGDYLVSGWTPETKKYVADFTDKSINSTPSIIGREKEFKTMLEGLMKLEGNNVLLVGNIGSGKENLVKAFAYHSFEGNINPMLNYRKVLQLQVGPFISGATSRSELETRLQNIVNEISHSVNVIMYLPEFQNIMGATSYNLDISGALLPYLQGSNLPFIASISKDNYKLYLDRNPIKEVFSVIHLAEIDDEAAIQMILETIPQVEKKNKVLISYRAIAGSVNLAHRFFQEQSLPGSAVSLLESVSAKIALTKAPDFEHTHKKIILEEQVVKYVEEVAHVPISMPNKQEIDALLHLEDKLHKKIINQDEAITAISEAMRRARSGMSTSKRPISFLFLGPTGVGKTETTKALASLYYHGEGQMIRLDMSEYSDEIGMKRLLGALPGEGNERGELTEKIREAPSSLVLLDEFEKAHPKILNLFLQVLEDGRLTDNKGATASFSNSIIIATSNAGSEFIREEISKGQTVDKKFHTKLLDYLQTKKLFKPELLNRFDDVIVFKPLSAKDAKEVVTLLLNQMVSDLQKQDIKLSYDDAVVEKISKEGFDPEFGARPLRRYIQDNIQDIIAKQKLTGEIIRGKNIKIVVDGASSFQIVTE